MTYRSSITKRNTELLFMFPFVLLGRLAGKLFPLKTKHDIFLFFPSADIGGSIKVNADIATCIKDRKPLIIFSKKPKNNGFRHLYDIEGVRVIDLHRYIDNKLFHFVNFFFRGVLASWINKAGNPVIFGGESMFFYKMLPHVKKKSSRIELCHLNTWFNYSIAFIEYIDQRIFSTPKIKRDVEKIYRGQQIDPSYFERLHFIDNAIDIPPYQPVTNATLQVMYAGRGAPQKRVHLIAEIAKRLHQRGQPVHFTFVGDVEKLVPPDVQAYTTLYGNVQDNAKMSALYQQSDALILTSLYEGLPIVVMEMLARGKVVISTAVDGIPDYLTHEQNGLLIDETDEEAIIEKGVALIERLIKEPTLKKSLEMNSYQFAATRFGWKSFCDFYRKMLVD